MAEPERSGLLIIDKPAGWTSHDVVAKVRRLLHQRRVGHAGTLDPMATGVLTVFAGRATRAVSLVVEGEKEYLAGLRLGVVTDTQDTTGTVLDRRPVDVTRADVEQVLSRFRGEQEQIPPMYSALKRDGKKLYELARAGKSVERAPRPITIYTLELLDQPEPEMYRLRVRCSKGTYVRTLCHDIGQALGCGGTMCALRRTEAAGFRIEQAATLDQLEQADKIQSFLRPVDCCFQQYPTWTASGRAERQIYHGAPCPCRLPDGRYRVYGPDGTFLMLGEARQGKMYTYKSFFTPEGEKHL